MPQISNVAGKAAAPYARKKLGIVGGMGSRAGVRFLQLVVDQSPAITDQEFIEVIFHSNSSVPDRTEAILYEKESPLRELLRSVDLMNQQNVDYLVFACITSYYYAGELQREFSGVILNPFESMKEELRFKYGSVGKAGILATTGTLKSGLFDRHFSEMDLKLVMLPAFEQENLFMKALYMKNGLKSAVISDQARMYLRRAIPVLEKAGAEILIGGCSEVFLGIEPSTLSIPYLDAMESLAKYTVKKCYVESNQGVL
ncbi:MAG TPA: amino acid racemase [Puia sp.]|nr:amino acid racemase [Puia sp.]